MQTVQHKTEATALQIATLAVPIAHTTHVRSFPMALHRASDTTTLKLLGSASMLDRPHQHSEAHH